MQAEGRYAAHGVEISSDLILPEFLSASGGGEMPAGFSGSKNPVRIANCETLPWADSPLGYCRVDQAGFHIAWEDVGAFHVTRAGNIFYHRVPGASDLLIRVPLLGAVLAVALHFRGTLVMHGNAMVVGEKGVILVGAKGQGKSTLSAALVGRGHPVHAEDAASVALPPGPGPALALRGTRQLRLWQDSVERSFGGLSPASRVIHELSDKRVVPLPDQPETPDAPALKRIYVIEDAADITLQPLDPAEAWQLVLTHSLVSRFGSSLLAGLGAMRHFAACTALAKNVPCVRLQRPRDFSRLGEVVARIERDLDGD